MLRGEHNWDKWDKEFDIIFFKKVYLGDEEKMGDIEVLISIISNYINMLNAISS